MNDSEIIKLFLERDDSAIEKVQAKYGKLLRTVSYNILGNEEDAEECVNDTYLALWYNIPPEKPDPMYPYVCKTVRNISLNRLRYNSASKRSREGTVCLEDIDDFLPSGKMIDDELEEAELTRLLNGWLESLDSERRYIFMRKYWYMDSAESIARELGVSVTAVYMRIGRMKKQLLKFLKGKGVTI